MYIHTGAGDIIANEGGNYINHVVGGSVMRAFVTGGDVIPLMGRDQGDHVCQSQWLGALITPLQSTQLL